MPWMISEKDDWVPRKVAPFLWLNQEANNGPTNVRESTTSHPSEGKTKTEASKGISSDPESKHQKPKSPTSTSESSDGLAISTSSTNLLSQDSTTDDDDDLKPKRMGRRARMFDLGKKVGEKFEEKRRHIKEKGRHIVEKMRGP